MILNIVETPDEFLVCIFKGIVRIQLIESGGIDYREQKIAEFLRGAFFIVLLQFSLQFTQLFTHLSPDIPTVFPVEAHIPGLFLDAIGLDNRWQRFRNTTQHTLVAVFLAHLDLLPVFQHLLRRKLLSISSLRQMRMLQALSLAIHMRMTEYQLIGLLVADVSNVKISRFIANFSIENHVHNHIAQFLTDVLLVVFQECVAQFKSLLYRIRPQALVGLFSVPGTFFTQAFQHVQQSSESFQFFFS